MPRGDGTGPAGAGAATGMGRGRGGQGQDAWAETALVQGHPVTASAPSVASALHAQ